MPLKQQKGYFFKKSLGQNILKDPNIIRKIIKLLRIRDDDVIVEIGPGLGALTDELVKYPNQIVAIEKDTRFADILKERYNAANIHIINDDALKYDYRNVYNNKKLRVVGNLPYNVSTQITLRLFEQRECFDRLLLMFQKEVALRIAAQQSTKDYSVLSVFSQYYSRPSIVLPVSRNCFSPRPKVYSAVVLFDLYDEPPYSVRDEKLFKTVVKTAFAHRRKTLHNCFKAFRYGDDMHLFDINEIFLAAEIDIKKRGETLSVEDFARLSERFYDFLDNSG